MSETNPAVSLDGDDLGMSAEDTAAFEAMAKGEAAVQEPPPEAPPEGEAEQQIEEDGEPPAEGDQQPGRGFVSQKALHAERMRRKEIEKRERELSEKNAVLTDRLNLVLQRLSPPAEQQSQDADPEPDPNVDLIAHHEWLKRQVGQIKEAEAARQRQAQEAQTAQQIEAGIFSRWQSDSKAFQASQPDTPKATEWLVTTRDKQLQAMAGFDTRYADPRVREQQIKAELQQIVIAAAKAGRNAAETVYEIARGWGYTPEQAAAAARQEPPTSERLKNIAEAQGAAKSLSGAGSRGAAAMSAEALASMSGAEQEAWLADPANDAAFRRMMGG
jgi:hypothetical protein